MLNSLSIFYKKTDKILDYFILFCYDKYNLNNYIFIFYFFYDNMFLRIFEEMSIFDQEDLL